MRPAQGPRGRQQDHPSPLVRSVAALPQQPQLARLDLQAEIFGVDAALGKASGDEPQARLGRAHEHVAQLLALAKTPDRADPGGHLGAKELADQTFLSLIASRQHDQVGGENLAASHPRAIGDEFSDVGKLRQPHLAVDDQIGAADVEIIAAAARQVFELPAGAVVAEIELEAALREAVEQRLIQLCGLFRQLEI